MTLTAVPVSRGADSWWSKLGPEPSKSEGEPVACKCMADGSADAKDSETGKEGE